MAKTLSALLIICLAFGLLITGCGPKKEASSAAAIDVAKTMETVQQKAEYLMAQAKAFYNSKEYDEAIKSAQYILRYLDKDSSAAREMIQKAQDAITAQAKAAAEELKKKLGN